jgi:hypothetical protein
LLGSGSVVSRSILARRCREPLTAALLCCCCSTWVFFAVMLFHTARMRAARSFTASLLSRPRFAWQHSVPASGAQVCLVLSFLALCSVLARTPSRSALKPTVVVVTSACDACVQPCRQGSRAERQRFPHPVHGQYNPRSIVLCLLCMSASASAVVRVVGANESCL